MSVQAGLVCYPDAATAAAAVASGRVGEVVPAGGVVYVVDAVADGAGVITYTLHDVLGVAVDVVSTYTPSFPACGLLDAGDGVALGWMVIAVWAAAYGVMLLRRGW